jgi:ferredoxin
VTDANPLRIETSRCIRCAACRALCPGVFDVVDGAARVVRSPSPSERVFVEAARSICPTDSIRGEPREDDFGPLAPHESTSYCELAIGAERARWALDAVPWSRLDTARVTPELVAVVREMAFSESATYSATQRFLDALFDELEMSKWISIWFYEETRHPQVLIEWLRRVGEPVTPEFEVSGRVTTPFMRSLLGTLVMNVISEIAAAQAYRRLAARSPEPVLAAVAQWISADEARHAATFFRFARDRLASRSEDVARRERARALEVLQAWLGDARPPTHPVAQMMDRLDQSDRDLEPLGLDFTAVRGRVVRVVGLLLDLPLRRQADVAPELRELLMQRGTT